MSMIMASFNMRGMGSRVKRRKVKDSIGVEKLDFLALQETKLEEVTGSMCCALWVSLPAIDKHVRCCVINVCNLVDKWRLWSDLLMTKRWFGDICLVLGG
jgi:hypothetical protein